MKISIVSSTHGPLTADLPSSPGLIQDSTSDLQRFVGLLGLPGQFCWASGVEVASLKHVYMVTEWGSARFQEDFQNGCSEDLQSRVSSSSFSYFFHDLAPSQ